MIVFRREEQGWPSDFVEPVADVKIHQEPQTIHVTIASCMHSPFDKLFHFGSVYVLRMQPERRKVPATCGSTAHDSENECTSTACG
jgi:hypothetical protein